MSEAVDDIWAVITASPPPSAADLENACHVYRDTGHVQPALFDDPQPDGASTRDNIRAADSRRPRPAPPSAGTPAASAGTPSAEDGTLPSQSARPNPGTRHTPSPAPARQHHPDADRSDQDTDMKDQAAKPSGAAPARASRPPLEAIDAAWAAVNAATPPSPADLDHARTLYGGTGAAPQPPPGSLSKTDDPGTVTPRPRIEPSPARPPRRTGLAADRQDELSEAASSPAEPLQRRNTPTPAATSSGNQASPATETTALPQSAVTPAPLTGDDIVLGVSRLPAFVLGELFHAVDNGQPLGRVGYLLRSYSGERAAERTRRRSPRNRDGRADPRRAAHRGRRPWRPACRAGHLAAGR